MTDYRTPWSGTRFPFAGLSPSVRAALGRSFLGYMALPGAATPAGRLGFTIRMENRNMLNLLDKQTGMFRTGAFYRELARANEQIAEKIQQGMVDKLEAEIDANQRRLPKPARTQRLERALAHYNNREVWANTFSVGRPSWLDQSPAKAYWRQIEYGNVKRPSTALWTNTFMKGDWHGPWSPGGGDREEPPPGYAHRIAIEGKAGGVYMIGPFPAYRYSRGGMDVARSIDYKARYKEVLLKALGEPGITLTGVFKGTSRPRIYT